ncbi:MAG: hypothetical protein AAB627_00260 [Patescibacteria group bacterium]
MKIGTNSALAVSWLPLVPCGISEKNEADFKAKGQGQAYWDYSRPCTKCDTFRLVDNVLHFILEGLVPAVAAVLFIYGGLVILLAGARPSWISHGKTVFWRTFWGLVIIFSSWMITNTFIKSFAPGQATDAPWYRFQCQEGVVTPGGPPPPSPLCSNPAGLAAQNNVPYPERNAPELNQLISCIKSKLPSENLGSIFTYDVNDPAAPNSRLCNFTRGARTCGACSHVVNSCHYGGRTGTQGALSVDFGNEAIRAKIQVAACSCGAKQVFVESTNVHVDSKSCDDVNSSAFRCP